MNMFDFIILAIVIISAVIGTFRGFIKEVFSLCTWVIAVFLALKFYTVLAPHLSFIPHETFRLCAAGFVIFLAVLILGVILNNIVQIVIQKSGLSSIDRFLGIFFGGIRGIIIVALLVFILDAFSPLPTFDAWKESQFIPYILEKTKYYMEYLNIQQSIIDLGNSIKDSL